MGGSGPGSPGRSAVGLVAARPAVARVAYALAGTALSAVWSVPALVAAVLPVLAVGLAEDLSRTGTTAAAALGGLLGCVLLVGAGVVLLAPERAVAARVLGVPVVRPSGARATTARVVGLLTVRLALVPATLALVALFAGAAALLAGLPFVDGLVETGTWRSSSGAASLWALPAALVALAAAVGVAWAAVGGHAFAVARLLGPTPAQLAAAERRRRAQRAQRDRLAGELHDSLGHSLTAIVLHAAGAARVAAHDVAAATTAMTAVESAGRAALVQLENTIAALRAVDAPGAGGGGVGETLPDVVAEFRGLGLPVTVDRPAPELPDAVAGLVVRVVREACANVVRHAARAATTVSVAVEARHCVVLVRNEAPPTPRGPAVRGSGHGLDLLRVAVDAVGGMLTAGPQPDGGFACRAVLPMPSDGSR